MGVVPRASIARYVRRCCGGSDDPVLSRLARTFIAQTKNVLIISAASVWEISTKVRLGKLSTAAVLTADFAGYMEREGFELLGISPGHAIRAGLLPGAHKDRLIACLSRKHRRTANPL